MVRSTSFQHRTIFIFLIVLLVIAVSATYATALRVYFLSDDYVLLTASQLRRFDQTLVVDPNWFFYRPLGQVLWWFEYRLFHYRAAFYHAISITLHILNSLLILLLTRRYVANKQALLAAALFALFPLHTEAVVWLASSYDLLATAGYVGALLCLGIAWERSSIAWYMLALAAFQWSLWSKETAFSLPLMVFLLALFESKRPPWRVLSFALLPFALLLFINLLQRYLTWGSFGGYPDASVSMGKLPQTLGSTALTLLAPLNQLVFPSWLVHVWQMVFATILLVGIVMTRQRRLLAIGVVWLGVTLIPTLPTLPVGRDIQNSRVLYLPAVGFCFALASAVVGMIRRQPRVLPFVSVSICMVLAVATAWQIRPWLVAGQNSIHVVQELHRLVSGFPPNSRVEVVNMPDNYKGAYIYRLGLDHSFGHHFRSTFQLQTVPKLLPLQHDVAGYDLQVLFGFNGAQQRWDVAALRYTSSDQTSVQGAQFWDLRTCPQTWIANVPCSPGIGFSAPNVLSIESPQITTQQVGWHEVVAVVETPVQTQDGELRLQWKTAQGEWISGAASRFNLPVEKSTRAYHFFLAPADGGQPPEQLRLEVINAPGTIVTSVSLRFIP